MMKLNACSAATTGDRTMHIIIEAITADCDNKAFEIPAVCTYIRTVNPSKLALWFEAAQRGYIISILSSHDHLNESNDDTKNMVVVTTYLVVSVW
jgi:hypothetical protein